MLQVPAGIREQTHKVCCGKQLKQFLRVAAVYRRSLLRRFLRRKCVEN